MTRKIRPCRLVSGAVAASFAGLRIATRYGRARRVGAGLVIGGGMALATWLNVVAGRQDSVSTHALSGALLSICGAAAGLALYPLARIAWLPRAAAVALSRTARTSDWRSDGSR